VARKHVNQHIGSNQSRSIKAIFTRENKYQLITATMCEGQRRVIVSRLISSLYDIQTLTLSLFCNRTNTEDQTKRLPDRELYIRIWYVRRSPEQQWRLLLNATVRIGIFFHSAVVFDIVMQRLYYFVVRT
jgi:hypothetical protein